MSLLVSDMDFLLDRNIVLALAEKYAYLRVSFQAPMSASHYMRKSPGGKSGVRLSDVQVVADVAETDPRRLLAYAARDRDRSRLPRRQHRLEPHDRRPVSQALLGRYHHMEAVGLVDVIDQGGAIRAELCPMAGYGSYIRRLGRRRPGNRERGGRKEDPHFTSHRTQAFSRIGAIPLIVQ